MTGREEEEDDCDDYVNDKFETEIDKSPSETGTYTVDKDEKPPSPPSLQVVHIIERDSYLPRRFGPRSLKGKKLLHPYKTLIPHTLQR